MLLFHAVVRLAVFSAFCILGLPEQRMVRSWACRPYHRFQGPSGTVLELKSRDLGDTWGSPRNVTELLAAGGATVLETGTSAGAALQLSPGNRHHPHRLVFAGYANQGDCNGQAFWWTDDGETYHLSRNATSSAPLLSVSVPAPPSFTQS